MMGFFTNGAFQFFAAITFDELVQHGIAQCKAEGRESNIVRGLPWSFKYRGLPVSHENDECYLVSTAIHTLVVTPDHILVVNVGNNAPMAVRREEFDSIYRPVQLSGALAAQPDPTVEQAKKLLEITRKFIEDNRVSCPEATTNDKVYENAPELVEQLAEVVGYYKRPDDDEG